MKYILDEQEYIDLTKQPSLVEIGARQLIQKLCTEVCNHKPVEFWGQDKEPWGCILSGVSHGYCDCCPVQDDCPYPDKKWSK